MRSQNLKNDFNLLRIAIGAGGKQRCILAARSPRRLGEHAVLARAVQPRERNWRLRSLAQRSGDELPGAPRARAAEQHRCNAQVSRGAEQEPVAQDRQRRQRHVRRCVLHARSAIYMRRAERADSRQNKRSFCSSSSVILKFEWFNLRL